MNRRTLLWPDKFRSRVRQRRDLIGGYVCLVLVLEMAAHIIDHVRDLGVGQVRRSRRLLIRGLPKRRHAVSAVEHRKRHEFPRDELFVRREFRISPSPDRSLGTGHMAPLAYVIVYLLAVQRTDCSSRCKRRAVRRRARRGRDEQQDEDSHAFAPCATARWCSRPMASSAEVTAPSCQPPIYEACSPASAMRPSILHKSS